MGVKTFLTSLLVIIVIMGVLVYFLFPFGRGSYYVGVSEEDLKAPSYENGTGLQFYNNMRFPDRKISYDISSCDIKKISDMENSFRKIEDLTILDFHSVSQGNTGEISITCSPKQRKSDDTGLLIAGEGGPTNITITRNFNVITEGQILLLRDSKCLNPNVGIHELLHVLGFKHSSNENSIMYAVSKCSQIITNDIINEINRLYSEASFPDLVAENFSVTTRGIFLDSSFTITNNGLKTSEEAKAIISINEKEVKDIIIKELGVGEGVTITLTNVKIPFGKVNNISLEIKTDFSELDKKNNKIKLKVND